MGSDPKNFGHIFETNFAYGYAWRIFWDDNFDGVGIGGARSKMCGTNRKEVC
jgi:hypothetical protein